MRPEDQKRFGPIAVTLKNNEKAVIRPLAKSDADALADFYASIPQEDYRFYCPHPLDEEHAHANTAKAESPLEVVMVLEGIDNIIAGYAWYRWQQPDDEKAGFGICVRRDFQGTGAGRALMARLNEVAKHIGPPIMKLTVQKANASAVYLYEKMGFTIVAEQMRRARPDRNCPAEPEYRMERMVR